MAVRREREGGWGGGEKGGVVLEVVAVGVVIERVQLVMHNADQPANGVGVHGQRLAAVFRLAHFLHQLEDLEAQFADFDGVVWELAVGDSRVVDEEERHVVDDVFLAHALVVCADGDDRREGRLEHAGAQQRDHGLDVRERLRYA